MPISPLSRVFGTRIPPAIKHDIEMINPVNLTSFKKCLAELEKLIFSRVPIPPDQVQPFAAKSAKNAGLSEDEGLVLLRLYAALVPLVSSSTSETRLREILVGRGIEASKATVLSQSLFPHRPEIEVDLGPTLGERFGPTLTRVFWRIDQPVAGSEPFVRDPVAVVTLVMDTATDTYDERFEVDLASLDLLLDELGNVRRELATLASRAQ
jgi:hypothetical protein